MSTQSDAFGKRLGPSLMNFSFPPCLMLSSKATVTIPSFTVVIIIIIIITLQILDWQIKGVRGAGTSCTLQKNLEEWSLLR